MELADTIVFFVEIVGTVAFALSGAVMAVQRRMDIFVFRFWESVLPLAAV